MGSFWVVPVCRVLTQSAIDGLKGFRGPMKYLGGCGTWGGKKMT